MAEIKLTITNQSTDLGDELDSHIYDLTNNDGLRIMTKTDNFPMPWDAGVYIEDGFFIISGDMGQQGAHKGWAKTGIPLDRVMRYLDISVYPENEEAEEELRQIFSEHHWL